MTLLSQLIFFLFLLILMIVNSGCSQNSNTIINTNQYTQTDYNFHCLDGQKTFTEIILCYQAQDKAEKAQNHITNEMIKNNNH